MKTRILFSIVILVLTIASCKKESTTCPPQDMKLVEGTWVGELDADSLVLTFIEGEFEGSPTLSGSGFITTKTNASSYIIMNGTHDRQKKILFSLYKYPVVGKEEFQLTGILNYNKINGTFSQFDQTGNVTKTGNWFAKTWY